MKPTHAHELLGLYFLIACSGCSIAMALHGNPEPNFEALEVGSTRKQVEIQLGTPVSSRVLEDGKKEDAYKYEIGNSPNGGRAAVNLYVDLYTIGLAEPILTVIELLQGHKEESQVVYDTNDRVLEVHGYTPPAPSAAMKAAQEAQEQYKKRPEPAGTSAKVAPR
jgi:hypothetical protein